MVNDEDWKEKLMSLAYHYILSPSKIYYSSSIFDLKDIVVNVNDMIGVKFFFVMV